jgi:hypothetical protein
MLTGTPQALEEKPPRSLASRKGRLGRRGSRARGARKGSGVDDLVDRYIAAYHRRLRPEPEQDPIIRALQAKVERMLVSHALSLVRRVPPNLSRRSR